MNHKRETHLKIEVEVVDVGDSLVDDCPRERVAVARSIRGVGRPEPRVVALSTDDDGQLWCIRRSGRDLFEGCLQSGQFVLQHLVILALYCSVNIEIQFQK